MSTNIDKYLKQVIAKVPEELAHFARTATVGNQKVYYTGYWQEDVLNNYTQKQSEKIFKSLRKYLDDKRFIFFQKKLEAIRTPDGPIDGGYEYYVRRAYAEIS